MQHHRAMVLLGLALLLPGCSLSGCRELGWEGTWHDDGLFSALAGMHGQGVEAHNATGFAWNRTDLDAALPGQYAATYAERREGDLWMLLESNGTLQVMGPRPDGQGALRAQVLEWLEQLTEAGNLTAVADRLLKDIEAGFRECPGHNQCGPSRQATARLTGPFRIAELADGPVSWDSVGSGRTGSTWEVHVAVDEMGWTRHNSTLRVDARGQAWAQTPDMDETAFRARLEGWLASTGLHPAFGDLKGNARGVCWD